VPQGNGWTVMTITSTIQVLILLLIAIAAGAVIAARLRIPPAILLVLTGTVLALTPGLPPVEIAPEIILLIVLPPLIYSSAVAMSWREFYFNLRPIALLAVGCVVFTTIGIAAAGHWVLGFAWPVGFVLGAIVSPPDPVAPLSIARRLRLPRRLLVVLEGEGLANDATALVLYRFAVGAVSLGTFSYSRALGEFAGIVTGELVWGIGVGWGMLRLRHWVRDPRVEIVLSVLTPFFAYWPPQQLGGSGVLATVAAGLYTSWNGPQLITASTRLQGIFFWDFLIYVIEGMVFLVTGLQVRTLIGRAGGVTASELAISATIVTAIVILARFIWVYPATYLPRWLIPAIQRKDPSPPWQWTFALGFTGIRGIVSLAAALAIPLVTTDGAPFPQRDLIIFIAFTVIVATLVCQGLMLPAVMGWLGLVGSGLRERVADRFEEVAAQRTAIEAALERLDRIAIGGQFGAQRSEPLRSYYGQRLRQLDDRGANRAKDNEIVPIADDLGLTLVEVEREVINELYRVGSLKDEARRQIERTLDLREADIINLHAEE
jgi:Na+/H+ antiporter